MPDRAGAATVSRMRSSAESRVELSNLRRTVQRSRPPPVLVLAATLSLLIVVSVGCSSKKKGDSTTSSSNSRAVATQSSSPSSPTSAQSSTAPAAAGLSGTWTGQYAGPSHGTFTLKWTQSGSVLTGTIDISGAGMLRISGILKGNSIRFGTLGQGAITYSGTVSGNSMSGTYHAPTGSGTWKATKAG
jgi:hypothetical protein